MCQSGGALLTRTALVLLLLITQHLIQFYITVGLMYYTVNVVLRGWGGVGWGVYGRVCEWVFVCGYVC